MTTDLAFADGTVAMVEAEAEADCCAADAQAAESPSVSEHVHSAGAESGCTRDQGAPAAAMAGCTGETACSSHAPAAVDQAEIAEASAEAASGAAAPPPAPAPADETAYGAPLALTTITPISTLMADWAAYEGKTVQIRGTVVAVCEHRGCWMDIAGPQDFQKIRFKVADGAMVFPITAKGGIATAEGTVEKLVVPVEQLRETSAARAKAAGEDFDPASITEPQIVWQLKGTGARIGA